MVFDSGFLWHESWQEDSGWEEGADFNSAYHLFTAKVTALHKINFSSISAECKEPLFWSMPNRMGSACSEHWAHRA